MTREYRFIFYKNDDEAGYEVIKVRLPKESCEKFCRDKGFKFYKILEMHSLAAHNLHMISDIVYFNGRYYFPEDSIAYPNNAAKDICKFETNFILNEEFLNDEDDFEETYNKQGINWGFGYLWTEISAKFILPSTTVELAVIAQEISKYIPEFLNKLKKEKQAVYINQEYSEFKWLAWVNEDKVRLIHQNYQEKNPVTEFDVLVDKTWFFDFCEDMIKTMKEYADKDLKRYNEYIKEKYGEK